MSKPLSYAEIFSRAWPIMLANAAVPLLGLVDTAVIGNTGSAQQLGAIALGALIFNFVYWSFGFLRMGTTGFTAQAAGRRNWAEVRLVLGRALLIAALLAVIIVACHRFLAPIIFFLFQASSAVETQANAYFNIRVWGAPATLATFALMGTLVGLGKSKQLLWVQLFLNGLNTVLDIFFAAILGWGVEGIAWGTIIAEYCTVVFAGITVYQVLNHHRRSGSVFWRWRGIFDRAALIRTVNVNRDIMIRTVLLVFSFAWFTNESAQFGDDILAANHILLQFVSFSAFFLDGYAFVAESIVGAAIGARKLSHFNAGVFRSSVLGLATGLALALTVYFASDFFIGLLTDIAHVVSVADNYIFLACVYIALSVVAFQLDGIFIGAIRAVEMRNAAIVSSLLFLFSCEILTRLYQNSGLWLAFNIYVIARAACLGYYFPRLRRELF